MTNDELRAQDHLIDRINRALVDGTGEVLSWTDENPSGHLTQEERNH